MCILSALNILATAETNSSESERGGRDARPWNAQPPLKTLLEQSLGATQRVDSADGGAQVQRDLRALMPTKRDRDAANRIITSA